MQRWCWWSRHLKEDWTKYWFLQVFAIVALLLNNIFSNFFIIYFHISLLDASSFVTDNSYKQEVTDDKDEEVMDDIVLGTVLKKEKSAISSSLLTKLKCATTSNKASPKPKLAKKKKSVCKDHSKDNESKEKKKLNERTTKCSFTTNHKKKELTGLSEE